MFPPADPKLIERDIALEEARAQPINAALYFATFGLVGAAIARDEGLGGWCFVTLFFFSLWRWQISGDIRDARRRLDDLESR